jgi:hypothetical protein
MGDDDSSLQLSEPGSRPQLQIKDLYDPAALRKPESVADLGRDVLGLHHVFGNDLGRRDNLKLIENDRIIYATSSAVVLENLTSGKKDYILAVEENGIGCVVVHPTRYNSTITDNKIETHLICAHLTINFSQKLFRCWR